MPIHGYPGGVISSTAPTIAPTGASGVWTTETQLQNSANWPSADYITRSLRFNSADSAYLNRTPASAGDRKTWTWSGWVKRGSLGGIQMLFGTFFANNDNSQTQLVINSDNTIGISFYNIGVIGSTQVLRDTSAWYHVVFVFDSTQATAANRAKLYINGSQVTSFAVDNRSSITQNGDYAVNAAQAHFIGYGNFPSSYLNGYLTEINFIDGQALTPSSFGFTDPNTGEWQPQVYHGAYGTNGFFLRFANNTGTTSTTLGLDSSGNGNNWTPNNFSVTAGAGNDSLVDSPSSYGTDTGVGGEVRGNYCTWNPLDKNSNGSLVNGNLDNSNGSQNNANVRSTFALPLSGKWYAELRVNSATSGTVALSFGFATAAADLATAVDVTGKYSIYGSGSGYIISQTSIISSGIGAFSSGDILQIAYDGATGKAWLGKNNTWYNSTAGTTGDPGAGTNQTFTLTGEFFLYSYYYNVTGSLNCGQRPFAYTAPAGFKCLVDTNLATPTIGATSTTRADDYFNTVLYTGTGSSLGVTGVGFQPDWTWIKSRSAATDHGLYDAVRGVQKQLESNNTDAETTETTGLTAFNSDGFTVGALAQLNTNTATYVAWNWKANGAGSSNTAGSITSTVSANTTAGFSIVTYTGTGANATVGHGLGVAPKFLIVKRRNTTGDWAVWHTSLTSGAYYMLLNGGWGNQTLDATYWNSTIPTSSVINVGTNANTNANGSTYVAYCFTNVSGFSQFGNYTGNGSTDGSFVYLGFRPELIIFKRLGDQFWTMLDSSNQGYNITQNYLFPGFNNAETGSSASYMDFLSNGFKLRTDSSSWNASGGTYIYAAFAEFPFKFARAR